jgi:O-antigen ligase
MFWFVVNVVKTELDGRTILHSFSLGFVLMALMESTYFFVQGGNPLSMTVRAGEFSGSSQWLSCFLVMGIPVLLLGALCEERGWRRTLYLSAIGISGVALFLVHTRSAWVAVMTQGLFYGALRLTRSWIVSGIAVFLAVGLLIVFLAIPGQHRELVSSSKFTSPSSMLLRFNTWDLAIDDIREHPLTGIGYGKASFQLKHPNLGKRYHTHIHNFFLSSTVQVGIPGFLFIAWIFWVVLHKSYEWRTRFFDQYLGNLSLVVFLMTVGLLVRILFDDMLIGNVVYLYMLLVGVCFSLGVHFEARAKMKTLGESG